MNTAGLAVNTANIAGNTVDILTSQGDIVANAASIAVNTAGVANNVYQIGVNAAGVASNLMNMNGNREDIDENRQLTVENADDISALQAQVDSLGGNLATNHYHDVVAHTHSMTDHEHAVDYSTIATGEIVATGSAQQITQYPYAPDGTVLITHEASGITSGPAGDTAVGHSHDHTHSTSHTHTHNSGDHYHSLNLAHNNTYGATNAWSTVTTNGQSDTTSGVNNDA